MEQLHDFMMVFRLVPDPQQQPGADTPEMQQQWKTWIGGIAAQARLVSTARLGFNGRQLQPDGSSREGISLLEHQVMGGNMIVKARDLDDAAAMAQGCPILAMGGTVEVRDIIPMQ